MGEVDGDTGIAIRDGVGIFILGAEAGDCEEGERGGTESSEDASDADLGRVRLGLLLIGIGSECVTSSDDDLEAEDMTEGCETATSQVYTGSDGSRLLTSSGS
jgi:hypothetical protein